MQQCTQSTTRPGGSRPADSTAISLAHHSETRTMLGRPSFKKGIHLMRHWEDQPLQVLRCTCWRKRSGHEYRGCDLKCSSNECSWSIDAEYLVPAEKGALGWKLWVEMLQGGLHSSSCMCQIVTMNGIMTCAAPEGIPQCTACSLSGCLCASRTAGWWPELPPGIPCLQIGQW